ncbi:hypothetical protein J7M22_03590 [Candidatus Poribacteria bacterium]|nr:hypothetical protein [Candidatus Poribacteria bacterium]
MNEKARIYTIFASRGYGGAGGPPERLISNDQLLRRLEERCGGVDFISRDLTKGFDVQSALNELEDLRGELDGVLIIGVTREYRLIFTGLPTIVVYNLFEFMNIPYELFIERGRVLTATLDRIGTTSPSISSAMFDDLVDKIDLIRVLSRMRRSTMISISPYKHFHAVDYQGDIHDQLPEGYNEAYTEALRESLGVKLIRVEPAEFYDAVKEVDERDAEGIAKMWIGEAKEVKDTTEEEVVKAAKMYLAFEMLRRRYGAVAISTHMRSLTGSGKVEDMAWPGIGIMEFQKRGLVGVCQDYPNIAATHLLGLYATGRPSMLGDLMVDTFNGVDIILHCGAPINPHGNDRVPYTIWSHAQSPVRGTGKPGSGTGVQVDLPVGEPVTVWKLDVLNRRILLHTGVSVDGRSLYRGFDELMCRTKLVVKVEAEKVQSRFCPGRYGIHRAATFGDLRDKVKKIATLIGFKVIEEDRS